MKNNKCYICGSSNLSDTGYTLRDSDKLRVLKCNDCSLMFLSSFYHIDENFYEDGKMHGSDCNLLNWQESCKEDDERRYRALRRKMKGKRLLDFGCGAGGFIDLAGEIANVYGLEKQASLSEYFKEKGLKVYKTIQDLEGSFDIITMFHVLEHLKTPAAVLTELSEYLKDDGEIIIEIPNSDDALLTLYKCRPFADFTHWKCHLFYFNEKSLRLMFSQIPVKINYIKPVQRYGFANHMYWIIKGKKGGHVKWKFLNFLDFIYKPLLKLLHKSDTLLISLSKSL